jgi:CubicO group peptidase (beta-lactamase class C family)
MKEATRTQTGRSLWMVLLLLIAAGCARESATTITADQSRAIDTLLRDQMKRHRVPGLAAAVVRNGVVVKQVTLGSADMGGHTPVSASTPFQLASTTKTFTSSAVVLLAGERKLALEDPIGDLLEGLPPLWRSVTVRQLLSHTSGLPDIVRTPGQLDLIADTWEKALPLIAQAPLQFEPGTKWAYTQTNYTLLALIVQRVSGMPLEAFLQSRFFGPLGMKQTFYASPSRPCAVNYAPGPEGSVARRALDFPPFVHAAGGLCSSVEDLVRWNDSLDRGTLLRPELTRELWTAARLKDGSAARLSGTIGYGLGWVVDDAPGQRSVGHSGGNSTAYRRFLDEHFTVIVLHNGVLDPDGLVSSIASVVRNGSASGAASAEEKLWDAAMNGDVPAIESALEAGADIEAQDTRRSRNGRRALNWAASNDHPDAIRTLLSRGASINAANKTGFTALHHAAESGAAEAAEALLAAGADTSLVNTAGERPAEVARRKGHPALAAAIEKH